MSSTPFNGDDDGDGKHVMGLRRTGSKVWKDIRGVIRAIGRSSRSGLEASADSNSAPVDSTKVSILNKDAIPHHVEESPKRTPKGIGAKDLIRKLRLNPVALDSNSTLVQRSPLKRARSSLLVLHSAHSSDLDTPRSSGASDKISAAGDDSTRKTSIESRSWQWNKETAIRRHRRNPWTRSSPEGRALSTIPEAGVVQARPTIATVERASAAKIFLETYFNELLYKPDTRALRRQCLESQLCHCLYLTSDQKEVIRASNDCQETWHLRELRAMKSKAISPAGKKDVNMSPDNYEPLQILGKGSFGVVRLVRERPAPGHAFPGQVYAMKVIRKSEMLRNSQEGHLRAERDFLVASEGSQWAVPLIASFQDAANLYLVMEYMPGGDFLGLLIRQNILREHVAQFYIAEMILAVEEAHRLNFIHRDIKPDNFLISASSHLKISDFGLAFDDHWSHDAAYYNSHRYSLVRRLGININGDEADQKSSKDILKQFEWYQSLVSGLDRHGKYPLAKDEDLQSLIGWRNRHGNRTAARSVVGTSQYMAPEVVLGQQYDGRWRKQTKQKHCGIQESLLVSTPACEYVGRYVFANDAEDIKAHRWFRNIPWDRLQSMPPPFTPHLQGDDDAHYFDESEPFEDWSESMPSGVFLNSEDVRTLLCGFETHVQEKAMELVKTPFDAAKLRGIDRDLDASKELQPNEKLALKQFVRFYGHKERRRPRDMLLRDKDTRKTVMKIRRETAFIGYTWRRMRPGGYIALRPTDSGNELEHS
ncbi:hypothetical protein CEP52_001995 [Fusarium oligoseptatum]|uniref:non-specific serine/threonine protein kinase n=1 Tax=Fusarium oligoseptatum TaxID=2604345 RepID=A0A428UGI3_9HYPO|nr:hypothetical protein CEP52_001995 [Fusarium oligoseptatum]